MGNTHKVSHQDQTPSELIKKKDQIQFLQNDFIRQFEGDLHNEYHLLSPALVTNNFYQLRKLINKKTKLCKAAFIINKYKVRSQQRQLLEEQIAQHTNIPTAYYHNTQQPHKLTTQTLTDQPPTSTNNRTNTSIPAKYISSRSKNQVIKF